MIRKTTVFVCLVFVMVAGPLSSRAQSTTQLLVNKAQALEDRGRVDLAARVWRQILISEPDQPQALAGMARSSVQTGDNAAADSYRNRLRQIDPRNPALIASVNVPGPRLAEAARLSQMKQPDKAMAIYREVFGNNPPPGRLTISYFETLAATEGGWGEAIAGLRNRLKGEPDNQEYRLTLGRLLTYQPQTRAEGIDLLGTVTTSGPAKQQAQQAIRQALVWENGSEKTKSQLKTYLAENSDPQLQPLLDKATKDSVNQQVSREGADVQRGYKYLKAGQLAESSAAFQKALATAPQSGPALQGLGFVEMQKKDFAAALKHFKAAEAVAPATKELREAMTTAAFWLQMQDGAAALKEHRSLDGVAPFRRALALMPGNPDALEGLAGALVQQGDNAAAAQTLESLILIRPDSTSAWRSLVEATVASSGAGAASKLSQRMPAPVSAALKDDAQYQVSMSSIYRDLGQPAEARKSFEDAVAALNRQRGDVPDGLQLEIAGLYLNYGSPSDGAAIYRNYLVKHPDSLNAWEGLIFSFNAARDWESGLLALTKLPEALREKAVNTPAFLRAAAAIYSGSGNVRTAETLLRRSADLETQKGQEPDVDTQTQLAQLYLDNHEEQKASALFLKTTRMYPESQDAWKGVVLSLHQTGRDAEAVEAMQSLPAGVREALVDDSGFLGVEAAVYSQVGQPVAALRALRRAVELNSENGVVTSVDTAVQMCWLLLKTGNNQKELLSLIQETKARPDLTPQQLESVSEVLATWILQTADEARARGTKERSVAILKAGANALPSNVPIHRALAGSYVEAGDTAAALVLYRNVGLKDASATDYMAAIGAASAEHQSKLSQQWLEEALHSFPSDSDLLNFAARAAVARGDFKKANAYWKSALSSLQKNQTEQQTGPQISSVRRGETGITELGALLIPGSTSAVKPSPEPGSGKTSGGRAMRTDELDWLAGPARKEKLPATNPGQPDKSRPGGLSWIDRQTEKAMHEVEAVGPVQTAAAERMNASPRATLLQPPLINAQFTENPAAVVGQPASITPLLPESLAPIQTLPNVSDITTSNIKESMEEVEGRNTPVLSLDGSVMYRSGDKGFQRMLMQESDMEASTVLQNSVRVGLIARAIFLTTPAPDGQSTLSFGLLPVGALFNAPSASGVGAEVQLSTANFGIRLGSTPQNFLVKNIIAGLRYRPGGGPVTLSYDRDTVKDTILSYAGARDPVSNTVWGGVVANAISVSARWGGETSGVYFSAGAQLLTGKNVPRNGRIDATLGGYWRLAKTPYGSLIAGANLFAMHYTNDASYFSLGQGGYFSPQRFTLLSVPVTWRGKWQHLEYSAGGAIGVQSFSENASPVYPLQPATGLTYPEQSSSGANFAFNFRVGYRFSSNWYLGGLIDSGNARFYTATTIGFSLQYALKPQVLDPKFAIPSIPDWRGKQPFTF